MGIIRKFRRHVDDMSHEEKLKHIQERQYIDRMNKMFVRMGRLHRELAKDHVPKWAQWASVHLPPAKYIHVMRWICSNACPLPVCVILLFLPVPKAVTIPLALLSLLTIKYPFSLFVWKIGVRRLYKKHKKAIGMDVVTVEQEIAERQGVSAWWRKLVLLPFNLVNLLIAIVALRPWIWLRKRLSIWGLKVVTERPDKWHFKAVMTCRHCHGKVIDETVWEI